MDGKIQLLKNSYQNKTKEREIKILLTNYIDIFITNRTVNYYKNKGYEIPLIFSEKSNKFIADSSKKITVKTTDLPESSHEKIWYQCDSCERSFKISYSSWNKKTEKDKGDFCRECAVKIKLPESLKNKYGYKNAANIPEVINKKKETNIKKYGNEWAIASNQVKQIIFDTWREKYNTDNPMKNEEVKLKAKITNTNKYGGNSPMCSEEVKKKSIETCMKKYGVENPFQSKEIQSKARQTLYKNKKTPTSLPEIKICEMLKQTYGEENCFPNFPEENLSLDCLVLIGEEKIDVEYDGSYWHKNRKNIDGARNAVLIKNGYRVLRIKGNNKDTLPTIDMLKKSIDYLIKENHHLTFIDMNE